jgi:hypothetical protein
MMCGFYLRTHYGLQSSPFLASPMQFEKASPKIPFPQTAHSLSNRLNKFFVQEEVTYNTQDFLSITC